MNKSFLQLSILLLSFFITNGAFAQLEVLDGSGYIPKVKKVKKIRKLKKKKKKSEVAVKTVKQPFNWYNEFNKTKKSIRAYYAGDETNFVAKDLGISPVDIQVKKTFEVGMGFHFPNKLLTEVTIFERQFDVINNPVINSNNMTIAGKAHGVKGVLGKAFNPFMWDRMQFSVATFASVMSGKTGNYSLGFNDQVLVVNGYKVSQFDLGARAALDTKLFSFLTLVLNYQYIYSGVNVVGEGSSLKSDWKQSSHNYGLGLAFNL